jgi:hypothetical protein
MEKVPVAYQRSGGEVVEGEVVESAGYGWCYIKSTMWYLDSHKQINKCERG